MRVGCCSVTEVRRRVGEGVVGAWEAVRVADGGHLREGASRDWGFEDVEVKEGEVSVVQWISEAC